MIKVDVKNLIVELDGKVETVLADISLALALVCKAGIIESTEGYSQEEAEAAIIATVIATKGWLNKLEGKDVDLKKIGEALMKTE